MAIGFDGRLIETDSEGYLLHVEDWSDSLMRKMADLDGIVLNEEHEIVITAVRNYYKEYATTPAMRSLIQLLKIKGYVNLASSVKLARLFPAGAAKTAARYAGLPKPVKCI